MHSKHYRFHDVEISSVEMIWLQHLQYILQRKKIKKKVQQQRERKKKNIGVEFRSIKSIM